MLRPAQRLFLNINKHFSPWATPVSTTRTMSSTADLLSTADPEQARLMSESVIHVDMNDNVLGPISKKDSHLQSNDLPLHRAFSLLLFDTSNRLLLQQRASAKVTFPSFWTNTVCSHPLHTPTELATAENDPVLGAKRAAIRKLSHELGVKPNALSTDDLSYLTRIHYRAECHDGVWGEHEIDYVFFARADLQLNPNPNEVDAVRYVTQSELRSLFAESTLSKDLRITPWFQYIVDDFAWPWWDALQNHGLSALDQFRDADTIHRMGQCGQRS